MADLLIRRAEATDVPALLDIYNDYVANTHITFDVEPRTLVQRTEWFRQFAPSGRLQCFVASKNGVPLGWASSHNFKDRAAYDTSVETSVYLLKGEGGQGTGRTLYGTLLAALVEARVHRAYGGIALPNEASERLHRSLGFEHIGTYEEVGRKFGRFWDVAWYQKRLA